MVGTSAFELSPLEKDSVAMHPRYTRLHFVWDLRASVQTESTAEKAADRYFGSVRLTFDGRALGFVDARGVARPVPVGAAAIRLVRDYLPKRPAGRGGAIGLDVKWIVVLDAAGTVLLRLPDYGWDHEADLRRWAEAGGLSFDPDLVTLEGEDHEHPDRVFPGYSTSPRMDPCYGMLTKRWWGWKRAK